MNKNSTKQKLKTSNAFILLFVIFFSCASLILINYYTIKILSASRAYVNGESHYSKAQKDAVRHLIIYLYTYNQKHWQMFLDEMKVPQGDGNARIGLLNKSDEKSIKNNFSVGRNSKKDLDDIIWLFQNFKSFPFLSKAINEWEQGDYLINKLYNIGKNVNIEISNYDLSIEDRQKMLLEINDISDKLTINERNFSNTLGEGTHMIKDYLVYTNIFFILIIVGSVSIYYYSMLKKLTSSHKKIEQKNLELIRVNKELDRFVYSASHDLRSPITSLKGLIEIAINEENPEELKNYLNLMNQSLTRQDKFISDIIDYSRNKRVDSQNEIINLDEAIDEVIAQHKHIKEVNEIKIHKQITVNEVYTDALRLKIILNNLVSNAIKYSDKQKNSKFIKIKTAKVNNELKIEVADNGIGIKEDALEKVFDMFFVTNTNLGSGLGLYITKEAVENLNGVISVNSIINKGTTFLVTIPFRHEK